ncbi:MAG: J domain-containing protein [bacterium]
MRKPDEVTFGRRSPYAILGVTPGAAQHDIRKAYLDKARHHHPDFFNSDPEKCRSATALMQDINLAYELLSDPVRREHWDRSHGVAPRAAPPPPTGTPSPHYDAELVQSIIRKYNEFLSTLRTPEQRADAVRRIRRFQQGRAGTAYIRSLIALMYGEVMDFLKLGRRISVYDDGLVEMMFLYAGALEVSPSEVFITYAWLVWREHGGKLPPEATARLRRSLRGESPIIRLQLPGPGNGPGPGKRQQAKGTADRVWDWLMSKPGSSRR